MRAIEQLQDLSGFDADEAGSVANGLHPWRTSRSFPVPAFTVRAAPITNAVSTARQAFGAVAPGVFRNHELRSRETISKMRDARFDVGCCGGALTSTSSRDLAERFGRGARTKRGSPGADGTNVNSVLEFACFATRHRRLMKLVAHYSRPSRNLECEPLDRHSRLGVRWAIAESLRRRTEILLGHDAWRAQADQKQRDATRDNADCGTLRASNVGRSINTMFGLDGSVHGLRVRVGRACEIEVRTHRAAEGI